MRQLCAGISIAGVRHLNHAHVEDHLAAPVEKTLQGGIERRKSCWGCAKGDGVRRRIDFFLLYTEDVLRQCLNVSHLGIGEPRKIDRFDFLAQKPGAIRLSIRGDQRMMRVQRD